MVGIGVIGYGYWGPNLLRNFSEVPGARVVALCDLRADRLALAEQRFPQLVTTRDYRELLANPQVDAVAIATPVSTHFEFGAAALRAGKHVFVEKPIAASSEEAVRLIDEAAKRNLVLMVDHTFVYTSAVRKIKVYDRGINVNSDSENAYQVLVGYRSGDMWAPHLDMTEALRTEAVQFVRCIDDRAPVVTDGESGCRVVRILEAATRSLADRGHPVEIESGR